MSKKIYYHATSIYNLGGILDKGIKVGTDRVVYLCKTPRDALKFMYIRGIKNILVCEVKVNDRYIEESFDHNEGIFKCKAYTYSKDIKADEIVNYTKYEL